MLLIFGLLLASVMARAAEWLPIEQQVAKAVQSERVTVVHFWAPWCPNCKAELASNGWSKFIKANPDVDFIFVTVWQGEEGDGRAMLQKYGVGPQKNFSLLVHPNPSRTTGEKMTTFMDMPVSWIPSTWVFRAGKVRYAMNYGELRFPILQQLVRDSSDKWDR
jgi:thiol-disulfide isomerase/thioredoxin